MKPWTLFSAHGRDLDVERCLVMGIVNATPDSFSDGGDIGDPARRDARIQELLDAGVDVLDVGGESTRPGHAAVSADDEIARVVPVIEAIRRISDVWISVDTSKTVVARHALDAGADIINDVSGLREPGMARLAANRGCSIVLMRDDDCHGDVVTSAEGQLRSRLVRAKSAGISEPQIILDAGLGFGTRPGASVEDNLALIDATERLGMGRPVLVGASRKRFVGTLAGIEDPVGRDEASHGLAVRARDAGASMVRVHDVAGCVAALATAEA